MDPTTVAAAASVLVKALSAGRSLWLAGKEQFLSEEKDLEALKAVVELWGGEHPQQESEEPRLAGAYLALISAAFGAAWREHWAGNEWLAPSRLDRRWHDFLTSDEVGRQRREQVQAALRHALSDPPIAGGHRGLEEAFIVEGISGDPIHTVFYRSLWRGFTEPSLQDPNSPPLLLLKDGGAREFERRFRLACIEAFATRAGMEVRRYLEGLQQHRAATVRELLLAGMVGWRDRHVFGTDSNGALPPMSLQDMYVEPMASEQSAIGSAAAPSPVFELVDRSLSLHPVVVVVADFGHGKSLTARALAARWAHAYLMGNAPSTDLVYPVFIKCAEDLASANIDVDNAVRRAAKRQAAAIGYAADTGSPAFAPPGPEQRTVYILDGLDEVMLGDRQLLNLLETLWEHSSDRHRYLIFSRPAAARLPPGTSPQRAPMRIELCGFQIDENGGQAREWLERWNAATARWTPASGIAGRPRPVTFDDICRSGLQNEAATPILLFMTAYAMATTGEKDLDRTRLYEIFVEQLAVSKHQFDRDTHPNVAAASAKLLSVLQERGHLAENDRPEHAMLWLMARTAWKARQLASQSIALNQRHVDDIIQEELDTRDDAELAHVIRIGLLLSLQADLAATNPRLLFGHRSFAEYLIARFWADHLERITARGPRRSDLKALRGGRLLGQDAQSFSFLIALLHRFDAREKDAVVTWAEATINDESYGAGAESYRVDDRAWLREAALGIGSHLSTQGVQVQDESTLRSLLAWFWLDGADAQILAPRLQAPKAYLRDARLREADFSGAMLDAAFLRGARLEQANLSGATLTGADLRNTQLWGSCFRGAKAAGAILEFVNLRWNSAARMTADWSNIDLTDARCLSALFTGFNFEHARFDRAKLQNAQLRRAHARGASFVGAQCTKMRCQAAELEGADFTDANLEHAGFEQAQASRAKFVGARLERAVLRRTELTGADFTNAFMESADLSGAFLNDAVLTGAHLQRAKMKGTILNGARLDQADLRGAKLLQVDLRGAKLRNADVRGAVFDGARIDAGTDFSGTDFTHARGVPQGASRT